MMRLRSVFTVLLCAWTISVSAEPVATRPATTRPGQPTIRVSPFQVNTSELPAWVGKNFQHTLEEDLAAAGYGVAADAQQTDYLLRGDLASAGADIIVSCELLHAGSMSTISRLQARGPAVDLLQLKDSIRRQLKTLVHPAGASDPAKPAIAPPAPAAVGAANRP